MDNTKIEWAESTWNPVTGCYHECPYCYAKTMVRRFGEQDVKGEKHVELDKPYIGGERQEESISNRIYSDTA